MRLAINQAEQDHFFMQEALKEAKKAFKAQEVPIGAVLVSDGKIVSRSYNQIELLKDATAHAEMLCITSASSAIGNWRLLECTLYCTLEPCVMCAGAMLLSRIKTLVWGAKDMRHGANGSWIDIFANKHPMHQMEIRSGVMQDECGALMQEFFRQRRNNVTLS